MAYDAGSPEDVRSKRTKRELGIEQEQADLKAVMATPQGQRLLWRVLSRAGIHQSTFDTNALKMAFFEGRRDMGLWLESEIAKVCPELYLEMQLHNTKEEGTNA